MHQIYAPLAPLVTAFSTVVFWISHYIYKYQLLCEPLHCASVFPQRLADPSTPFLLLQLRLRLARRVWRSDVERVRQIPAERSPACQS